MNRRNRSRSLNSCHSTALGGMPLAGRPVWMRAVNRASARRPGNRPVISGPISPPLPSPPWQRPQRVSNDLRPGSLIAGGAAGGACATTGRERPTNAKTGITRKITIFQARILLRASSLLRKEPDSPSRLLVWPAPGLYSEGCSSVRDLVRSTPPDLSRLRRTCRGRMAT